MRIIFFLMAYITAIKPFVFSSYAWGVGMDIEKKITNFKVDLTVPPLSGNGYYYIWPGLQSKDMLLQNVLGRRDGSDWDFVEWLYSGTPGAKNWAQPDGSSVQPGNTITSWFHQLNSTDTGSAWLNTYTVNCDPPVTKAYTISIPLTNDIHPFGKFVLSYEFPDGDLWVTGPVDWDNLELTAEGSDQSWCTASSPWKEDTDDSHKGYSTFTQSAGVVHAHPDQGSVMCSFQNVHFGGRTA